MIEEESQRRLRLETLKKAGIDPYPTKGARTHTIERYLAGYEALLSAETPCSLVGRIRTIRRHGGLTFFVVEDESGKIQMILKQDIVGSEAYELFHQTMDIGDFVEGSGRPFTTKKGEKSLLLDRYRILSKSLLPLPEKWHGLSDTETRFRKRYLDLIMNPEVRGRMLARSRIISSIRALLDSRGFIEIETPTLQPIYGGGFARPFKTRHNALDADFYLRISDELYLKRCLVGSFEKVYEITKVFRNEGIDRDHNPEFTMFEAQIAYENYEYGMDLFEEIFERAALDGVGGTEIRHGDVLINLKRPWPRMRMVDAVASFGGLSVGSWTDTDKAKAELGVNLTKEKLKDLKTMKSVGEVIAFAFEELVEEKLIQPTIIYDYPVEVSPLAKKSSRNPHFVERFEAFALGSEIGNNYSELNDPVDLEQRFILEKKREAEGFGEAHQTDLDYLEAIKHGMPPACGLGIGIDRMVMLLTGAANIKEVILFPTLRPEE